MQKAGYLHGNFPIMRTELWRKSGRVPHWKEETALCLRTERCEPDSLSMSRLYQQPEGSWSCVGNHGVCVGRHSCFPALWTLRGITARSTSIVGLLREKEWWIISLMHHPSPVLAVSFRWCGCELRKTRGWERVTERAGAICYLLSHSRVSRENIIGVCVLFG